MANVMINGTSYEGIDTVKLPLSEGGGYAVFSYSHDEESGDTSTPTLPETSLLYKLSEETVLDGVDDFIYTDVLLWSIDQDFTIAFDVTPYGNANEQTLFAVNAKAKPYQGMNFISHPTKNGFYKFQIYDTDYVNPVTLDTVIPYNTVKNFKMAITHRAASGSYIINYSFDGSTYKEAMSDGFASNSVPLVFGGADVFTSTGTPVRPWNGVIHDLRVHNYVYTDDEVTAYLNK